MAQAMNELELTRVKGDRRRYALEAIGELRLEGLFSRAATAEAGAERWRFVRRGVLTAASRAVDAAGAEVGTFDARDGGFRRGGTLRWSGRELTLRPASAWRERYALADGERELVVLDGKGWGRRPVKIALADGAQLDPGLVLFAAFVVNALASDASGSAGGTAAVIASTG